MHSLQLRRSPQRRGRAASHANSNGRISSGGPFLGDLGKHKSVTCPEMEDGNSKMKLFGRFWSWTINMILSYFIQFLGSAWKFGGVLLQWPSNGSFEKIKFGRTLTKSTLVCGLGCLGLDRSSLFLNFTENSENQHFFLFGVKLKDIKLAFKATWEWFFPTNKWGDKGTSRT